MDRKRSFEDKLEKQIRRGEQQIEKMRTRKHRLSDSEDRDLKDLEKKNTAARKKLQELRHLDGGDWEYLIPGIEQVWGEMSVAIRRTSTKVS